jgi:hypothetical protein
MSAAGLVAANVLMLIAGLGLLPLLGVTRSWRELVARSGLAYLCGLVLAGIVAANLALVRVSFGWIGLFVLAVLTASVGTWRLRGSERPVWRRPGWIPLAGSAVLLAVFVEYERAFAVAPLDRYDAWAIWAFKGRALYELGWADPVVFAGSEYRFANLDYPLLLPTLEAIDFHALGSFDTRLLHLQFLLLLVAGCLALVALLRDRTPQLVLWPAVVAIALAPAVFDQLLTAYADIPLALVFAVGLAAAGRWLVTNERWALAFATLCFAGAVLTKNEGTLFVAAAFVALAIVAWSRVRSLVAAAAVVALVLLPWKLYVWTHDLQDINYSLADSFDLDHLDGRLGIGPIAFRTLGSEMLDPLQWGLLVPVFAVLAVAAVAVGLRALPVFAVVWALVAWLGLSWIYVISHHEHSAYLGSTKERVIASIVLGSAALIPLLAGETWTNARARRRLDGAV